MYVYLADDDDEKPARDEIAVLENRPSRLQLVKVNIYSSTLTFD